MLTFSTDQQRFLIAQTASLLLALPYRLVPKQARNIYNLVPGLIIVYYCYGKQANLFLLFSVISFLACKYSPQSQVQKIVMSIALTFLSFAHLSRQILDYGGYKIDISGPYMIAVQKVTSLAYCLFDGNRLKHSEDCMTVQHTSQTSSEINDDKEEAEKQSSVTQAISESSELRRRRGEAIEQSKAKLEQPQNSKTLVLTDEQAKYAIRQPPSFIEFMGYFFHFPSVNCGPIMYFNDYKDFIDFPENEDLPPKRFNAVFKKLTISFTSLLLCVLLIPRLKVSFFASDQFLMHTPFVARLLYLVLFTTINRIKYYVAWHFGEASSNATGLGFNGYDDKNEPKWDLISNMDLYNFEFGLNLRECIHAWNKTTQTWLRRTAYERVPRKFHVLATYILSAFWHGFYPGYYLTFVGGAIFTYAARSGRRIVRPLFQTGKILPRIYDVITFVVTRLTIAYIAFPFVILDFRKSWEIYRSLYFCLHIAAILMIILGYLVKRK